MISALEALNLLRRGNQRFVADEPDFPRRNASRRKQVASRQQPFAALVGCSDSRVPAEIVFDCGLGDLFVIRVAGNIVAPSQIGSVEFAAEQCGARLVVVLGHTECGAIQSTVAQIEAENVDISPNLGVIVDFVRPVVAPLMQDEALVADHDELVCRAVRANVCHSVDALRERSRVLERLAEQEGLLVVGAEYALDTGVVDFFYGLPEGIE